MGVSPWRFCKRHRLICQSFVLPAGVSFHVPSAGPQSACGVRTRVARPWPFIQNGGN